MSAVLVSAIRDLGDIYKKMSERKLCMDSKLRNEVSLLEKLIISELNRLSPAPIRQPILDELTSIPKVNHRPLVSSNSVAGPSSGGSTLINHDQLQSNEHRRLDRSMSEPVEKPSSKQRQPSKYLLHSNSSRYKTELCRPFEENGSCKYGEKCQFAHGYDELRTLVRHPKYKTELCRTFHTTGLCPYGPRCHFIHNDFHRSHLGAAIGLLAGSVNLQSGQGSFNSLPFEKLDICGSSIGSAGDISPNSSSISGSPCSNSFMNAFMEDNFTTVQHQMPKTAPPVMPSAAVFFGGQDVISNPANLSVSAQAPKQSPRLQHGTVANQRIVPPVDLINAQLGNLSLGSNSGNSSRNVRLPIFSQLSFGGKK